MQYQKRHMDTLLKKYLENFPAIMIEGAKGVGEKVLAKNMQRQAII